MRNAGCVLRSSTPAICSTAPAWRPMMPGMMSTQGRIAMDVEAYDRAWRIEQRAEELFKHDYPRDRSRGACLTSARPTPIPSVITTDDWLRRSSAFNGPRVELCPPTRRRGFQ
jgi:hypothetical protein